MTQNGVHVIKTILDSLILQIYSNNPNARIDYLFIPMLSHVTYLDVPASIADFLVPTIFLVTGLLLYRSLSIRMFDDKMTRMR